MPILDATIDWSIVEFNCKHCCLSHLCFAGFNMCLKVKLKLIFRNYEVKQAANEKAAWATNAVRE